LSIKYSPVKHGVIRVGHKLANNIDIPLDLYQQTLVEIDPHSPANLEPYKYYIDAVLDAATLDGYKLKMKEKVGHEIPAILIKKTCKAVYNVYNPEEPSISHSESLFNYNLLHPIVNALSKSV
jgi:hypothetical protein